MVTGRPPLYSGVRINGPRPALPWDSLPKRAAVGGYAVRWDAERFRNFASLLLLPDDAERIESGDALPPAKPRTLDLLYDGRIDRAAHHHGTAGDAHRAAVTGAAARAERIWRSLDPSKDLLVIVSEHGHRVRGGHGGAEPEASRAMLIAAGKGVSNAGILRSGWMRDLAPTLARLLGVEEPADSLGAPMTELLGLGREGLRGYDKQAVRDEAAFRAQALARVLIALAVIVVAMGWLARKDRLGFELRDFGVLPVYLPIVAAAHTLMGLGVSWSSPTSQVIYQTQTAAAGIGAAIFAIRTVARRDRACQELAAALSLAAPAYVLSAAWVGVSLERIAGPFASFGFVLLITIFFYVLIALALRVLWLTRDSSRPSGHHAIRWAAGAALACAIYAVPVVYRLWAPR